MGIFRSVYRLLGSVQLTVLLLLFSLLLIFFGTLDQVHIGIREAQKQYFESLFVAWFYPSDWPGGHVLKNVFLPLLGGYLLGSLLIVNLVLGFFRYFRASVKKIGIMFIHGGLMLLIISGFLTSYFQQESQMWISTGGVANYSQSTFENEFVIIDQTDASKDRVVSVPVDELTEGRVIRLPGFGLVVKVDRFFENAVISRRREGSLSNLANRGAGLNIEANAVPRTAKPDEVNTVSAYVTLLDDEQREIGRWLVSNLFDERFPVQQFSSNGRQYEIGIRFKRYYYPFALELMEFRFDRYPGTQIPKNFSSLVKILDPEKGDARQALIYMNHPLRYEGLTFFQASFSPKEDATMLQVVKNESWVLPYIAVFVVGVGLLVHFTVSLVLFLRKR